MELEGILTNITSVYPNPLYGTILINSTASFLVLTVTIVASSAANMHVSMTGNDFTSFCKEDVPNLSSVRHFFCTSSLPNKTHGITVWGLKSQDSATVSTIL